MAKLILYEKSLYDEAIDFNKIGQSIKKAKDTVKKAYNDRKDRRAVKKAIKKDKKELKKKTGAWNQFKTGLKGGSVFDDMSDADLVKHAIHLKKGDKKAVAAYLASNINKYKADKNSKLASKFEKAKSQFDKAKDDEKHPMNKYAAHVGGKKITNKDVKKVTDLDGEDNSKSSDKKDGSKNKLSKSPDEMFDEIFADPKAAKSLIQNLPKGESGAHEDSEGNKVYIGKNKKGEIHYSYDIDEADDFSAGKSSKEKDPKDKTDKKDPKKDNEEDDISWRDALSKSKFLGSAIGTSKKDKKDNKLKYDDLEDSTPKKKEDPKKDPERDKAKDTIKNLAPGEQAKYKGKYYSRSQSGKLAKFDNEIDSDKHSESDDKNKSLKDTPDKLKNMRLYSDLKEVPKDKNDLPDNFKYKDKFFSRNKDGELKAFATKEAADHWAKAKSRDENKPEKKDLKKSSSERPYLKLAKNVPTAEDVKNFKMEM